MWTCPAQIAPSWTLDRVPLEVIVSGLRRNDGQIPAYTFTDL